MIKEEHSMSSMESSKTLAMEKPAAVQVVMMETLKERMEIERQKFERDCLVHEKDTLCRDVRCILVWV
jgi:hypothetical protein